MCPFCFGSLGLVIAGTVSTGGLLALTVKLSRHKGNPSQPNTKIRSQEGCNADTHDG